MSERAAKNALFDALSSVAAALGNGRRAEIVDVLAQGERSVEEVAGEIGQSVANTSHHLRLLARAGLARTRREGNRVLYRLASERVAELWGAVRDIAALHVAEVAMLERDYLGDRAEVERLSAGELADRLERGEIVLLDVRPEQEYRAGHIPGALSAPLELLPSVAESLSRRVDVVAYCRGPYCVYADDAVRLLRAAGLSAARLDVGFPEWRRTGRPVATAN